MINRYFVLIYILGVLLVSGFAHAVTSAAPLPITSYAYDADSFRLHVTGHFNNTCQQNPRLMVTSLNHNAENDVATLQVISTPELGTDLSAEVCTQIIWGAYDLVVDIRTLDLPTSTNLKLKLDGLTASQSESLPASIPFQILGFRDHEAISEGVLVRMREVSHKIVPYMYGITSKNGIVMLKTPLELEARLENYVGSPVLVSGLNFNEVQETTLDSNGSSSVSALSFLQTIGASSSSPLMIVTGVSTIPAVR